ncbi:MAG: TIGR01459 family HAD-type hydrolase [Pseudomonadota bacterium]
MTQIVRSLSDVSERYDAVLCDLWGCLHNGVFAFPEAIAALQAFRAKGGTVVLLTNAPRARSLVAAHLDTLHVPRDAWDTIATSGDSARAGMFRGVVGQKVYFIGEDRDHGFFDPLKVVADPLEITRVALPQAEGIVCTGPFDSLADPEVNRPDFLFAKQKGLKFLCANPDIVVDRGETREWCAGALAALYTEMGGESLYFGKPHPGVYDLSRARLRELGKDIPNGRILAIGDGINTDIKGAIGEDIDSMFVTGGLAAAETRTDIDPEPAPLETFLAEAMLSPTYAIGKLR